VPARALAPTARSAAAPAVSSIDAAAPLVRPIGTVAQTPAVRLTASLSPERLGGETTVHLGIQIARLAGGASAAVTAIAVLYPAELGIGTSGLGLDTCSIPQLQAEGQAGCPANSLVGYGSALVEVPFDTGSVFEHVRITLLSGPLQEGHPGLLFYVSGRYPVLAHLLFPGVLLPSQPPFGGLLDVTLPLVPAVPEGPDVALVRMSTTIGPRGLVYHERIGGRMVAFHPQRSLLPRSCPRGGFPFAVSVTLQSGAVANGSATVPCPRRAS
jgi:hypothetical protein